MCYKGISDYCSFGSIFPMEKRKDNRMKKKSALFMICLCMLVLAVGCKKTEKDSTNIDSNNLSSKPATEQGVTPTETITDSESVTDPTTGTAAPEMIENELVRDEYNVDDYIELGQYKGLEIKSVPVEVTEDDITIAIQQDLAASGKELVEVNDEAAKLGDTVNIDFEGVLDGVAFEGGTSENFDLMLGSNSFIEGFEAQLIGAKKGEKRALDLTFPENYQSTELAGQQVVFNVTVNKIQRYELTESFVTENTEYKTLDAYKEAMKANILVEKENAAEIKKSNDIYELLVSNSKIELPETTLKYFANDVTVYYTNQASMYGMDLPAFLGALNITQEMLDKEANAYASSMATREVLLKAIAKKENIVLTEDEYNAGVEEYAASYGVSVEELMEGANVDLLREDLLYNKIMDYVISVSVEL